MKMLMELRRRQEQRFDARRRMLLLAGDGEGDGDGDGEEGSGGGSGGGKPDDKVSRDTKDSGDSNESDEDDGEGDGKPKDGEGDGDDDKSGAPDKYDTFKIPDGFTVNDERLEALHTFGKEHNLPQEAVQAAVDLHVAAISELVEGQQEAWKVQRETWESEIKTNKDYHDENGKPDAAIAQAMKAVEAIGGDALKEALDSTGAGSHPAVFALFHELAQHMEGDKIVFGGDSVDNRNAAQKLYPTMKA